MRGFVLCLMHEMLWNYVHFQRFQYQGHDLDLGLNTQGLNIL